jgi:hypothetical protein
METVTAAIVQALSAGALSGAQDAAKAAVADAYRGLKALLLRKTGGDGDLAEAIDRLEAKPDSPGWREEVAGAVARTGAADDPDVRAAADALLERLQALPDAPASQTAIGTNIAQAQDGSTASVKVTR